MKTDVKEKFIPEMRHQEHIDKNNTQKFSLRYLLFVILIFSALGLNACQSQAAAVATETVGGAQIASTKTIMGTATRILPSATIPQKTRILPSATASMTFIPTHTPHPTETQITTFLFTGVIVPARCVQAALDEIGNPDYPYEEVRSIIQDADFAVGTFNATMSDKVEHTGCVDTYHLVGSPDNADALARAGFDLMSVATNHIKDSGLMKGWSNETFSDTLDNLHRVGIQTVGAGENLDEALEPVFVDLNGIRFGFVSLGDSKLDESVFATDTTPGIARLTEENMRKAIAKARANADVVIAMPHWGSEDIFIPNWLQLEQAKYTVDAGADLVVGNHTHVVQGYQEIDGVMVFYGLGNFVFDQGLRDHRQGIILLVRFRGEEFLDFKLIPTHTDRDGRVHLADSEEAAEILANIENANYYIP